MSKKRSSCGFTLIEMMIVISLIVILISIAVPVYSNSLLRAKEATLRQDLFTLRNVIEHYTMDYKKAPPTLDDLRQAKYIREIPKDPFTGEANWTTVQEDSQTVPGLWEPGIFDVHSASNLMGTDGTAYSSW